MDRDLALVQLVNQERGPDAKGMVSSARSSGFLHRLAKCKRVSSSVYSLRSISVFALHLLCQNQSAVGLFHTLLHESAATHFLQFFKSV